MTSCASEVMLLWGLVLLIYVFWAHQKRGMKMRNLKCYLWDLDSAFYMRVSIAWVTLDSQFELLIRLEDSFECSCL